MPVSILLHLLSFLLAPLVTRLRPVVVPVRIRLTRLITNLTLSLTNFSEATVGAFIWTFEARNGAWSLNGITPPPIATLVPLSLPLVIPLASLGNPAWRLTSTRRPLALFDITPQFSDIKVLVTVRVPEIIRPRHLPNLGRRVLQNEIVPVVT